MGLPTQLTLLILGYSLLSVIIANDGDPPMCLVEWETDWDDLPEVNDIEFYPNPGEIITGITVNDVLRDVGLAWNAPSWLEITGLICVRYGQLFGALLGEASGVDTDRLRTECEAVFLSLRRGEKLNLEAPCNEIMNEQGTDDYLEEPLGVASGIIAGDQYLNGFGTIEHLSPIVFELLEWLGPSPFSVDYFGVCSGTRLLLGTSPDEITNRIQTILEYPLADFLGFLGYEDICENNDPGSDRNDLYIQLLDDFSGADEASFCQFIATNPTEDELIERANNILENIERFLTHSSICVNVMTTLNTFADGQQREFFHRLTSGNMSMPSAFCNQVSDSFSSTYVPSPYSVPAGRNLSAFRIGSTPGELLPGFFFEDAVGISGAFIASDTLADGLTILCTVFKAFVTKEFPEESQEVTTVCNSLRSKNFAAFEAKCRDLTVQWNSYSPGVPTSLRPPTAIYMIVTAVEFVRQLFNPRGLASEDVCLSLDEFYRSDHNLQSVIRLTIDVYLAEFLPIAHDICVDYDNIRDFFQAHFGGRISYSRVEKGIITMILAHLGHDSREEICRAISDGIDPISGRANEDIVGTFERELLAFLTNDQRCEASMNAALDFTNLVVGNGVDIDDEFTLYTGYSSTTDLCTDLSKFFTTELCEDNGTAFLRSHLQGLVAGIISVVIMTGLI